MKAGNGIRRAAAVVLAVMMAMAVVPVAMAAVMCALTAKSWETAG